MRTGDVDLNYAIENERHVHNHWCMSTVALLLYFYMWWLLPSSVYINDYNYFKCYVGSKSNDIITQDTHGNLNVYVNSYDITKTKQHLYEWGLHEIQHDEYQTRLLCFH